MISADSGRARHILAQALAYAVELIDRLPPEEQPAGDQAEMKEALKLLIVADNELAYYQERACRHVELVCR